MTQTYYLDNEFFHCIHVLIQNLGIQNLHISANKRQVGEGVGDVADSFHTCVDDVGA